MGVNETKHNNSDRTFNLLSYSNALGFCTAPIDFGGKHF